MSRRAGISINNDYEVVNPGENHVRVARCPE